MTRFITAAAFGLAATLASAAFAQDRTPYHIRGTLDRTYGDTLTVTDNAGEIRQIAFGADARLFVVDAAVLGDIAEGQFVGITSIMSGGDRVALEVHIFEESLRGLAEGHYPWSLVEEENMMTNANVATMVALDENRQLTVTYAEGEGDARTEGTQTILVPTTAAIVHLSAADRSVLKTGEGMFFLVVDSEDGGIDAIAAVIGRNGVKPPM